MITFLSPVWTAFIVGLFMGTGVGIFIIALLVAARNDKEEMMASQELTHPEEGLCHKYPVLKIPTGRRRELLIIGIPKAEAILANLTAIRSFVAKHAEVAAAAPVVMPDRDPASG